MANIFDYLEWRGDLTFNEDGFNEVDNLILSNLAYLKCDGIVSSEIGGGSSITLSQLAEILEESQQKPSDYAFYYFPERIAELLKKAAKTVRFQNVLLSGYENQIDYEISKQFSAVAFTFRSNAHFIAFRGTDNTFTGWKENMYMSFMDEVQAQKQSVEYVKKVMLCCEGKFYLGGHSKGGNLAIYAATHLDSSSQKRIISVYNNDGPGFQATSIQRASYQNMLGKLNTFIPKGSVVGRLLEHGEEYKVVDSIGNVIFQHDAFMWEVKGSKFVYEKELSKNSHRVDHTIRLWLDRLSPSEREKFIEALFEIIEGTGVHTFNALGQDKMRSFDAMTSKYRSLDSETKTLLKKTLAVMLSESQKVFRKSIGQEIDIKFSAHSLKFR